MTWNDIETVLEGYEREAFGIIGVGRVADRLDDLLKHFKEIADEAKHQLRYKDLYEDIQEENRELEDEVESLEIECDRAATIIEKLKREIEEIRVKG